jgi:hypothetical protein
VNVKYVSSKLTLAQAVPSRAKCRIYIVSAGHCQTIGNISAAPSSKAVHVNIETGYMPNGMIYSSLVKMLTKLELHVLHYAA